MQGDNNDLRSKLSLIEQSRSSLLMNLPVPKSMLNVLQQVNRQYDLIVREIIQTQTHELNEEPLLRESDHVELKQTESSNKQSLDRSEARTKQSPSDSIDRQDESFTDAGELCNSSDSNQQSIIEGSSQRSKFDVSKQNNKAAVGGLQLD